MNKLEHIEFIVLTCDKYIETRVNSIKASWGIGQNIKYLTDSSDMGENLIGYKTPQNYAGIQDKVLSFFKNYDFSFFDYYFFVDDDTFVNLVNLSKLILPSKGDRFAIIRELRLNPDRTDKWGNNTGYPLHEISGYNTDLPIIHPSGGSGFILSQESCRLIQKYLNSTTLPIPRSGHSDVTIAFWMRNCDITLFFNENLWWDTHEKLLGNKWSKYISDKDILTFHYVDEKLMKTYNEKYNLQ